MNFKNIEDKIKKEIEAAFDNILKKYNYIFPISAKSRSGAEISDYLEDCIVEFYVNNENAYVKNIIGAPKGKTKNPFDFCFDFVDFETGFEDLIWADIKATKHSYNDSNPDLGTPEKIIKFIMDGHFYLLFVFFEYESTNDNQTKFIPFSDGKYVHCQFLKDINHTVRINPKPQFQVNINQPEEYRTIEEFIELFYKKYQESIDRIIYIQSKKKSKIDNRFVELRNKIEDYKQKRGIN